MPQYLPDKEERAAYNYCVRNDIRISPISVKEDSQKWKIEIRMGPYKRGERANVCLLYTSPSPRDRQKSRMPSSA